MKDLYYILGTDSNCSPDAISEAYRKLAKRFEPAYGEEDDFLESHFREISEAYEILSDPARRKLYDASQRKIHKKQVANFKTRYLNMALTGSLILFTGVFGFYVVRSLNINHTQQVAEPVKVATVASIAPHVIKHHKKKTHNKIAEPVAVSDKPVAAKKDTIKAEAVVAIKPAPITVAAVKSTLAPVKVVQVPVVTKQPGAPVDSSYTTYLKPNLSGSIYLHQMADYMSAVVTVLPHNSLVKVLQKGPSFYKIAYNNQVGYLPRWMVVNP
ncbi:J domain-containing protein [Mucilaginibacter jinjuensis]|uniref:DnaJ domain-containing protein n=1 Tax=Mucilaginibacter jinjuensis TaxID=1176721 RepID=A0ABY7THS8_9SPHI|nr:DnaJ domain-containing protein [Mucilaginibacter jinjuensis]WCT14707.1 DnaJ domain-containing protein [Mucilaginibacter jinjuensis]